MINLLLEEGASLTAINLDDKMPVDVSADSDVRYILQQRMLEAGEGRGRGREGRREGTEGRREEGKGREGRMEGGMEGSREEGEGGRSGDRGEREGGRDVYSLQQLCQNTY